MNNQQATKRPASAPTSLNRRFIDANTEVLAPGVTIHWAAPKADRRREAEVNREKEFFHDFGPRYTRRHPGPQARG